MNKNELSFLGLSYFMWSFNLKGTRDLDQMVTQCVHSTVFRWGPVESTWEQKQEVRFFIVCHIKGKNGEEGKIWVSQVSIEDGVWFQENKATFRRDLKNILEAHNACVLTSATMFDVSL